MYTSEKVLMGNLQTSMGNFRNVRKVPWETFKGNLSKCPKGDCDNNLKKKIERVGLLETSRGSILKHPEKIIGND